MLISSIVVARIWQANTSGWYIGSTIWQAGFHHHPAIHCCPAGLAAFSRIYLAGEFTNLAHPPDAAGLLHCYLSPRDDGELRFQLFRSGTNRLRRPVHYQPCLPGGGCLSRISISARVLSATGALQILASAQSVLASSLFFGGYHILYLAGEPLPVVLARIVFSTLLGIVFGAFVLRGESIYPAAIFHGILNMAGYLNLASNGVEGTTSSWLWMSLFILPLALSGVYLLRGLTATFTPSTPLIESRERV